MVNRLLLPSNLQCSKVFIASSWGTSHPVHPIQSLGDARDRSPALAHETFFRDRSMGHVGITKTKKPRVFQQETGILMILYDFMIAQSCSIEFIRLCMVIMVYGRCMYGFMGV